MRALCLSVCVVSVRIKKICSWPSRKLNFGIRGFLGSLITNLAFIFAGAFSKSALSNKKICTLSQKCLKLGIRGFFGSLNPNLIIILAGGFSKSALSNK